VFHIVVYIEADRNEKGERERMCEHVSYTSTPPLARFQSILRVPHYLNDSYLVDPASSICLSQGLSHACLSINIIYCETAEGSLNQL
jgi:hypothetical protein